MKKTNIIAAAALIASFGLAGCGGGGGGSNGSSTATVNGTAVDPELIGATVCLDINSNGECEANEPSTKTNMDGNYTLRVSTDQIAESATLLLQGGYDRVTKMPFIGTMTAMIDEANLTARQMITPLTTLVYERAVAAQEDMRTAQEEVAALLGLTVQELEANMMDLEDQAALQAAMAMQQAAELAADTNDTRVFYRAMAEEMPKHNQFSGLIEAVADSNLSGAKKERIKYFAKAMDEMQSENCGKLCAAMSIERMQEMIADMNESMFGKFDSISGFITDMMVTSDDEVEVYVTVHLLEAAGIAQPIIDEVKQQIVDHADITVDTSFGMMITIIGQLKTDGYITETQYNEMLTKLNAMKIAFEA